MSTVYSKTFEPAIVIYHHNCADGFSAAWCFYHYAQLLEAYIKGFPETEASTPIIKGYHGPNFEFYPGIYQESPPNVTGRIVYMVDFSYKKEVVKEMCAKADKVWLIDHHKTAIDDLLPLYSSKESPEYTANLGVYIDQRRSGAMLAWDFLFNSGDEGTTEKFGDTDWIQPPVLLEHVQDRDLWKFKLAGTREIQAAMFSREYTFENWNIMMLGGIPQKMELWKEGAAIERKHFKDINELLTVAQRTMWIDGQEVPVCNLPYTMASDAGNMMCLADTNAPFAACYFDTKDHRVFSLRSLPGNADVSEIAKKYGGGGHANASGFRVPREHILAIS